MPSPFPGMDPYLEGADWRSVQTHLSVEIARTLVPLLSPKYYVRAERNYILEVSESAIQTEIARPVPDVAVSILEGSAANGEGGLAILQAPLHLTLPKFDDDTQIIVEIYDAKDRTLVTAIEVLSITNKTRDGRSEYLAKRQKYLRSRVQLIEIDLLRNGIRVPLVEPLPATDYLVVLSRAERRPIADVWPILVRETLPVIPVPLRNGDADVLLDLQSVLNTMYDAFRYDLEIDYSKPPEISFGPLESKWAVEVISEYRRNRSMNDLKPR